MCVRAESGSGNPGTLRPAVADADCGNDADRGSAPNSEPAVVMHRCQSDVRPGDGENPVGPPFPADEARSGAEARLEGGLFPATMPGSAAVRLPAGGRCRDPGPNEAGSVG